MSWDIQQIAVFNFEQKQYLYLIESLMEYIFWTKTSKMANVIISEEQLKT